MSSIVFTQFVTPVQGASRLDLALACFGARSDAEIAFLEDLFDMTHFRGPIGCHEDAIGDIVKLSLLSLPIGATQEDIGRLLTEARPMLERLLQFVRTIPLVGACAGAGPSNFNAWLHRSDLRLEGLLGTLRPVSSTKRYARIALRGLLWLSTSLPQRTKERVK